MLLDVPVSFEVSLLMAVATNLLEIFWKIDTSFQSLNIFTNNLKHISCINVFFFIAEFIYCQKSGKKLLSGKILWNIIKDVSLK